MWIVKCANVKIAERIYLSGILLLGAVGIAPIIGKFALLLDAGKHLS